MSDACPLEVYFDVDVDSIGARLPFIFNRASLAICRRIKPHNISAISLEDSEACGEVRRGDVRGT